MNSGVVIYDSSADENGFKINFKVSDSLSRLILVHVAEAANIQLDICACFGVCSSEAQNDPDSAIMYCYNCSQATDVLDKLCWLGAHLVWKMHKVKVLNRAQEKQYCNLFGAVSRST